MRALLVFFCLAVFCLAVFCLASFCLAGGAQDAAVVNPKMVKVEFENSKVRILRVRFGPHEKLEMHSHPAKAEVQLTDGSVRITAAGGKSEDSPRKAGEFFWFEPTQHAVENTGHAPLEFIEIEMKQATGPGVSVKAPPHTDVEAAPEQEPFPVQDEPHHHWAFENQYVRVLDVRLLPGESTLLHTHSHDNIAVRLSETSAQTQDMGKDWEPASKVVPGEVSYREGAKAPYTHRVKNVGSAAFHVIDIEVLR